jgi:hypothetical protein
MHLRRGSLERFSNSYALASFVKCGFFLRKKPLNGLFSEYTYWRTAIAEGCFGVLAAELHKSVRR